MHVEDDSSMSIATGMKSEIVKDVCYRKQETPLFHLYFGILWWIV
jgi:hypothetical protein